MPEIDPERFKELVKRRDWARAAAQDADSALKSAEEAHTSAESKRKEAEYNLADYVNECSGDPKVERFFSRGYVK